jgi:hypothetical protein
MRVLSPAQLVGYVAFVLGAAAFLQKSDRRLKFLNASQGVVYALHFLLLGNLPASGSSAISAVRSFLALRFRSLVLALAIVAAHLAVGVLFAHGIGWLPVIGSSAATVAIFTMSGIRLRSVLLGCTLLWLVNNIASRSIGGTALELTNFTTNLTTILRMSGWSWRPAHSGDVLE